MEAELLSSAVINSCQVFPDNNVWNARIDSLLCSANSADYVNSIGSMAGLHPDFGSGLFQGQPIGIPFRTVPGTQPLVPVTFVEYPAESDPGPYPIPPDAPIERESDRHVLVVDIDNCKLYELFHAHPQNN